MTKIPIGDLSEDEAEVLETMNERLRKLVVGQEKAVESVCLAIKRGRLGLCDENKPRASFLFVGPSGVGKSQLARVLGEEIGSFIDIDMLSLGYKSSLEGLIGSANRKSELIEKITKNPYSVVMFDNVDTASDDALSIIYEILDRGYLTDFSGQKVDFTNSIIILTVNSSSDVVSLDAQKKIADKLSKSIVKKVTDVILFNNLSEENYSLIVKVKLSELESRLHSFGINAKISDEVISHICKLCCDEENSHGARVVAKLIRENIEIPISDLMMKRELKSGEQVHLLLEDEKIKFKITKDS